MTRLISRIRNIGWKILEERDNILVLKKGDRMIMKYNSITYSIFDYDKLYTHFYYDYFIPLAYVHKNPKVLIIGLGGGAVPFQLDRLLGSNITMESVDTDRDIVEIARKYFIGDIKMKTHVADGAEFVAGLKNEYDLIILDAFKNVEMPKAFKDEKFIKEAKAALKDGGILVINSILKVEDLLTYTEKLRKEFDVTSFEPSLFLDNTMIVCIKNMTRKEMLDKMKANMSVTPENRFLMDRYEVVFREGLKNP